MGTHASPDNSTPWHIGLARRFGGRSMVAAVAVTGFAAVATFAYVSVRFALRRSSRLMARARRACSAA